VRPDSNSRWRKNSGAGHRQNEDSLSVLHWAHVRISHVLTEEIDAEEALNKIMIILDEPEVRIAAGLGQTPA